MDTHIVSNSPQPKTILLWIYSYMPLIVICENLGGGYISSSRIEYFIVFSPLYSFDFHFLITDKDKSVCVCVCVCVCISLTSVFFQEFSDHILSPILHYFFKD